MLKTIYTPLSGSVAQEKVMDIIANNLANTSTVGFKQESVTFKQLLPEPYKNYKNPLPPANYKVPFEKIMHLHGNDVDYVGVSGVYRDQTQGPAIETKSDFDLLIDGPGYFQVQTPDGERLTRNGSFTVNDSGVLSDQLGHPVLGEQGLIYLRGKNMEVNHLGEIYQDGQMVDRLKTLEVSDERNLERVGYNLYFHGGEEEGLTKASHMNVRQGYVEGSNVNVMQNLTNMIVAHRSYEAYQKTIQNYDKMMEKSSNSLGEVRG
ncbi:MAG: flagellar hook-basal body protein [Oligoflexales bacterium]